MQRLTYINVNQESVVFDKGGCIFKSISGLGAADLTFKTLQGAYQQGESLVYLRREKRVITVNFHLYGETRAELYAARRELERVISAEKAFTASDTARLFYENDDGKWFIHAVPEEGIQGGKRVNNYLTDLKLTFRCPSPFWLSTEEKRAIFRQSGDGFQLPFQFPITFGSQDFMQELVNDGQTSCPVTVEITGSGEVPQLINMETGTRLKLTSQLPQGYKLLVNTDRNALTAVVTDTAGNETSAFGLLDVASPVTDFVLRPGRNRVKYDPGGEATGTVIAVRWRDRYEGI